MEQLKKCPFCGGKARINVSTLGIVTVDCTVCHACSNAFFKKNDGKKEAIKAWNTRKPMERIVEKLKKSESYSCSPQFNKAIDRAIEIVKEEMK